MVHRAGLNANVVSGGTIATGDEVIRALATFPVRGWSGRCSMRRSA